MTALMCLPNVRGEGVPDGFSRREYDYRGVHYCIVFLKSGAVMHKAMAEPLRRPDPMKISSRLGFGRYTLYVSLPFFNIKDEAK